MPTGVRTQVDEEAILDELRAGAGRQEVATRHGVGYLRIRVLAEMHGIPAKTPHRGGGRPREGGPDGEEGPEGSRVSEPVRRKREPRPSECGLEALHLAFTCGAPPAALAGRPRWPRPG